MNYPQPLELHDYRYLGRGFRERERIKRKKQRWTARLRSMPDQERYCLMQAIGELRDPIARDGEDAGGIVGSDDIDDHQLTSLNVAMLAATTRNGDARWPASAETTMLEQQQ